MTFLKITNDNAKREKLPALKSRQTFHLDVEYLKIHLKIISDYDLYRTQIEKTKNSYSHIMPAFISETFSFIHRIGSRKKSKREICNGGKVHEFHINVFCILPWAVMLLILYSLGQTTTKATKTVCEQMKFNFNSGPFFFYSPRRHQEYVCASKKKKIKPKRKERGKREHALFHQFNFSKISKEFPTVFDSYTTISRYTTLRFQQSNC